MGCAIRLPDKSSCTKVATHRWGPVEFCCEHFDQFVDGLFDLRDAFRARRHIHIVEEYNRRTNRTSVIPGANCDSEKK